MSSRRLENMTSLLLVAGLSILSGASALQLPMGWSLGHHQAPVESVKKDLINSTALQETIEGKNLLKRAKHLYEIAELSKDDFGHPTRVIGSKGHHGTLDYIYSTIAELGDYYSLSNQSFPAVQGSLYESRLVLGHTVPSSATPMGLTPPTRDHAPVYGQVVLVSNQGCDSKDYPSNINGNIALIKRGTCTFGQKSTLAGRAGAIAAVVYNNEEGRLYGSLQGVGKYHVATFGISDTDAAPIIKRLQQNIPVDGIVYIDADVSEILTTNIIAQTTQGDPNNCVMLGGHSDSVDAGPGINDDGSGSMTLLEVATQLSKFKVNNCVRFAWWSGEEEGLLGSDFYVYTLPEEENMKIRLFMDYDMLGSPNFAYQVYYATNAINPTGSEELRDLYTSWYQSQGLNYSYIAFDGRSDYDGFIKSGIPGGGIATGAEGIKTEQEVDMFGGVAGNWYDPCYHQLCDGVGNVNMTAWELNTKLVAHSVATYALSLKGFPERTDIKSSSVYEQSVKYHGNKLIM